VSNCSAPSTGCIQEWRCGACSSIVGGGKSGSAKFPTATTRTGRP
jgi:hypothetical protein